MKQKLLFILFGVLSFYSYSQKILWEKTMGGKYSEYLFDMTPTPDNGFILAGSSLSNKSGNKTKDGNGNLDYFIWKMDKDGEEEWQLSFGGSNADILKNIISTSDGGYMLGGYSNSDKSGDKTDTLRGKNDIWLVKLNAKGGIDWQKTIGGNGDDKLVQIKQIKGGGYLVVANSNSTISGEKQDKNLGGLDYWVLKLDKTGNIIWQKTFGGIYNDEVKSVLLTKNDEIIIGGSSNSPISEFKYFDTNGGFDFWILKLDAEGNLKNQKVFGGESDDFLTDIIETEKGFIIAGTSSSNGGGNKSVNSEKFNDFWVIKTDFNFENDEQFTYDFKGDDYLTSIIYDSNSDEILLGGYQMDEKTFKKSYISLIANAKGEEIWNKKLSTDGSDLLRKVTQTRDGGFVFAGNSNGKISADKKSSQGRDDYWIVKLKSKEKEKETEIKLEAFPNPTEQYANIVINHEYTEGTLSIVDLAGRILHTETISYDMVPIDLGNYPVGIYVIHVKTDVFNGSVKVIKK
ncbi:T9SS type A sorting domain-containing protein [Flavobacterium sp. I3-2]|uniref:T9SS type A sorting domain-containing protein n=1 Tax=Flavobacterium sp. I3-2 TaxID=2748319 RepID=UPI0015AB5FEC|nr:T9SS type A sorting domain-containing protein [Flavobacterium sp. I3-2]